MASENSAIPAGGEPVVYLIDDDPNIGPVVELWLGRAGFACQVFSSAAEFLEKLDPRVPGCLLLDIRMPRMTGPELQAALNERHSQLPIVFLSADVDVPMTVELMQKGATSLMKKPLFEAKLIEAVQHALAKNAAWRVQAMELNELRQRANELTPREREVADLLSHGNSSRQIALVLGLSERTVEIHRARVMSKMKTDSVVSFGIDWVKLRESARPLRA